MRETKGVTLISLIITIVILLILLGLTDLILPDDLFNKAKEVNEIVNTEVPNVQGEIDKIEGSLPDITEDESGISSNYPPTLSVSVRNTTSSAAYIMASAQDEDGDLIKVTLKINGKTYTITGSAGNATQMWEISNLSDYTTYTYTVTVTDGFETETKTGSLTTLCAGNITCTATTYCTAATTSTTCSSCGGNKFASNCPGSFSRTAVSNYSCSCGETCGFEIYTCSYCGVKAYSCISYGHSSCIPQGVTTYFGNVHYCGTCKGSGMVYTTFPCVLHGLSYSHYYCTTHNYIGMGSIHTVSCKCGKCT